MAKRTYSTAMKRQLKSELAIFQANFRKSPAWHAWEMYYAASGHAFQAGIITRSERMLHTSELNKWRANELRHIGRAA